jgi:hypothetical protein
MAKGQGMRRRNGESSNMYEDNSMPSRAHSTHSEAVAQAATSGSPRLPIGVARPERGTLMPRKNVQSEDPTIADKANRQNVLQERLGARYAIQVGTPAIHPIENGPSQAQGKILPSAIKR